MQKIKLFSILVLLSLVFVSCDEKSPQKANKQKDSTAISEKPQMQCDSFMLIKYTKVYISSISELEKIKKDFNYSNPTSSANRIITTLNRKEFRFFHVKDSLIIPEMINSDMRAYSIFPSCYPGARDIKKIIMVSNKYQCYACYEYGKLVRFSAANTGKERSQTYPGRYALSWRERERKSSIDSTWIMPYTWNFHLQAGNAFHQFDMPGRPVSHSCVRQFMEDAKWLFSWGEKGKYDSLGHPIELSGTPVLIIDNFDFSRKRFGPWLDLISNQQVKLLLPEKPMEYEIALIPICQIPTESRGSLKNRARYENAEEVLRSRGTIRPQVTLIETRNFNKERRIQKAKEEREKKLKDTTSTN